LYSGDIPFGENEGLNPLLGKLLGCCVGKVLGYIDDDGKLEGCLVGISEGYTL
jgi:hypothetical protein